MGQCFSVVRTRPNEKSKFKKADKISSNKVTPIKPERSSHYCEETMSRKRSRNNGKTKKQKRTKSPATAKVRKKPNHFNDTNSKHRSKQAVTEKVESPRQYPDGASSLDTTTSSSYVSSHLPAVTENVSSVDVERPRQHPHGASRLDTTTSSSYVSNRLPTLQTARINTQYQGRHVGLRNGGATCYMNSIIQQLYHTPEIKQVVCTRAISKARQEVLQQIHRIFRALQTSSTVVTPRDFWNVFKLWGQSINTCEQQDAYEFYTDLVNQLDECLKNNDQPEIFKATFQGVLSDVYQCQDTSYGCNHRFEREEEFYGLTVSVKSSSLEASLYQLIEEVELKDDNAYLCELCSEKRTAVKRTCIQTLPSVLTIQLKRFRHDAYGRVVKTNNYFTFPWVIDMAPYTQYGLLHRNQSSAEYFQDQSLQDPLPGATCASYFPTTEDDVVPEPQEYSLVGVVVHSGSVHGGHYYSIIRDRRDGDLSDPTHARWITCNDSVVSQHRMSQESLKAECFGGSYRNYAWSTERSSNAYILFYQKISKTEKRSHEKPIRQNLTLPPIHDSSLDNKKGLSQRQQTQTSEQSPSTSCDGYSTPPEYMQHDILETQTLEKMMEAIKTEKLERFFEYRGIVRKDRLKVIRKAAYDQDVSSEDKAKLLEYMLDTFFRLQGGVRDQLKDMLEEWSGTIKCLVSRSEPACKSALEYFISHMSGLIVPYFLEDPDENIRNVCARMISYTLEHFFQHHKTTQLGTTQHLDIVVDDLLSLLDNDKILDNWQTCNQFLSILYRYLSFAPSCIQQVLSHDAFRRLMAFSLRIADIKNQEEYDNFKETRRYLHSMLATLILHSDVSPLRDIETTGSAEKNDDLFEMSCDMKSLLTSDRDYVLYIKEAVQTYYECGSRPVSDMLQHLSFCNTNFSVAAITEIMCQIATCPLAKQGHALFKLLKQLLLIEDCLLETRVKLVLDDNNGLLGIINRCKYSDHWRSYRCIRCLMDLWKSVPIVKKCLKLNWWQSAKRWHDRAPISFSSSQERTESDDKMERNIESLTKLSLHDTPASEISMTGRNCTIQQREEYGFSMKISNV
ncbi:ubiquitin carboxyl-terminal hydrolase 24-like [Amphiura filiformis]|uniref:ubiquitin carboxyl-terminal hydrolase 24-like n=1 Tax=Amphiura filiformis TaxID=82378 RepID=UPI003B226C59